MKLPLERARAHPDPQVIRKLIEAGIGWEATLAHAERHPTTPICASFPLMSSAPVSPSCSRSR
jgi:hypothetical protein